MPLLIFNHFSYTENTILSLKCLFRMVFSVFFKPSTFLENLAHIFAIVDTTKGAVLVSIGVRTTKRVNVSHYKKKMKHSVHTFSRLRGPMVVTNIRLIYLLQKKL